MILSNSHSLTGHCRLCGATTVKLVPENDNRDRDVCSACGFVHYDNPKLVIGTLATYEGKVLLCRRAIEPRYGYWTLPAGFMECLETMEQAACRETHEEALAVANALQLYAIVEVPHISQIHVYYTAEIADGHFGAGEESLECALFAEHEIPWGDLSFPSVTFCLKRFFDDRKLGLRRFQHIVMEAPCPAPGTS